jgi:hypothetical protein
MAVTRALLAALVGVGCLGDPAPFRCDLRGGDRACDAVSGGVCVERYCAEPVNNSLCASGLRYTASAATPGACAPPRGDASPDDVVDATLGDIAADTLAADTLAIDTLAADIPAADIPAADIPAADIPAADTPADLPTGDIVDAARAIDVAEVAVPPDAPGIDASDVVAQRDVVDGGATIDATDVPDSRDAPYVLPPICAVNGRIVSPLPNERLLGRRVDVRVEGAGANATALLTTGIHCEGTVSTAALVGGVGTFVDLPRGYICVAAQSPGSNGHPCRTPWRRVALMAGNFGRLSSPHLGFWPDFDNDGWADLLVATGDGTRVLSAHAMGGFAVRPALVRPDAGAIPDAMAAVGDLDGDGYGDAVVLWSVAGQRALFVHQGGSGGLTRAPVLLPLSTINASDSRPRQIHALGDRDGDGRTEVGMVVANPRTLLLWSVNPQGAPVLVDTLAVPTNIVQVAAGADLTGDRRPDIAIAHGGRVDVFPAGAVGTQTISPSVMQLAFGDVMASGSDTDGNGVSELIVRDSVSNSLQVYRRASITWVRDPVTAGSASDTAVVLAAGDLENVAPDDLVVLDAANLVRVRRGGFDVDLSAAIPWSPQASVLLAGTSVSEVTARVVFPRSGLNGQHGLAVLGLNGTSLTTVVHDSLFSTPIRLIAR